MRTKYQLKYWLYEIKIALLRTISTTLSLILQHDIYLPAYEDHENIHLSLLQNFTDRIIEWSEKNVIHLSTIFKETVSIIRKKKDENSSSIFEKCTFEQHQVELQIFKNLLNLNHHLVYDKLHLLLGVAGYYLEEEHFVLDKGWLSKKKYSSEASKLFCAIVSTYGKLRQINHLFSSFLKSIHLKLCRDGFMKRIFHDTSTVKVLLDVIQNCPSGQIDSFPSWNNFYIFPVIEYSNFIPCFSYSNF